MNPRRLSNEFRLLAACCEWPASARRDDAIRKRTGGGVDWALLLRLAKRHRVEGLVHRALAVAEAPVPSDLQRELSQVAVRIGTENLFQMAESLRLKTLFAEAAIPLLFVKGLPLAKLAYDTIEVKKAWDIDILVAPEHIARSAALLVGAGYKRIEPADDEVPADRFREWPAFSKESLWTNDLTGSVVELHSGLSDNPRLIPDLSIASAQTLVPIGAGIELPTLAKDELFAYVCVHGATHGWSRLKWLADLAALLRREPGAEIERLYRRSLELGAGRTPAQALLLCSEILSLPLPQALAQDLKSDIPTRWLCRAAIGAMAARGETELDDTILGTASIQLSHFLLGKGWRYKVTELGQKGRHPLDDFVAPLPRSLRFLYPVAAMPRWMIRRARLRRVRSDAGAGSA